MVLGGDSARLDHVMNTANAAGVDRDTSIPWNSRCRVRLPSRCVYAQRPRSTNRTSGRGSPLHHRSRVGVRRSRGHQDVRGGRFVQLTCFARRTVQRACQQLSSGTYPRFHRPRFWSRPGSAPRTHPAQRMNWDSVKRTTATDRPRVHAPDDAYPRPGARSSQLLDASNEVHDSSRLEPAQTSTILRLSARRHEHRSTLLRLDSPCPRARTSTLSLALGPSCALW